MEQFSLPMVNQSEDLIIRDTLKNEINNPEYSKYLFVGTNKDSTISIKAKSYLVTKIKLTHKTKWIIVRTKNLEYFKDFIDKRGIKAESAGGLDIKEYGDWSRIPIESLDDVLSLSRPICVVYMLVLSELGGERFGCCSRYVECSDKKECINPNFLMSRACGYRRNLEAGRIFYGKNKNI